MTNWKDHGNPFLDFTEELTYEWMRNGFSRKECKEWLDIGMKAEDTDFCAWLKDEAQIDAEWVSNYGDLEELKKRYTERLYLESQTYVNNAYESSEEVPDVNNFYNNYWEDRNEEPFFQVNLARKSYNEDYTTNYSSGNFNNKRGQSECEKFKILW